MNEGVSSETVETILLRRDALHPFSRIDPKKTAHLVIDLQNGFLKPGEMTEVPGARAIVPNVNRISAALRNAGGTIVYILNTFDAKCVAEWSNYFKYFVAPGRQQRMVEAFTPGAEGHALWPELDYRAGDLKVEKRRFGAFVEGSSNLHAVLQSRNIDTVIISGTVTNVCCESTARDAMMMNYKVLFVADANAAHDEKLHDMSLNTLALAFADVTTTEEVVHLIEKSNIAGP